MSGCVDYSSYAEEAKQQQDHRRNSSQSQRSNGSPVKMAPEGRSYVTTTHRLRLPYKEEELFCRYWSPAGPTAEKPEENPDIKALVFLSHGYGEHLGWYSELAAHLAKQGFLVFGHDHVGHGLTQQVSEKSRRRRGVVEDMGELVEDVFFHASLIKQRNRGLPAYIYGHSMGGMVALKAYLNNPAFFRGLILEGPFIKAHPSVYDGSEIWYQVARIMNQAAGNYIPIGGIPVEEVTSVKDVQDLFVSDPLNLRESIKLTMGLAFIKQLRKFSDPDVLKKITCPLLIMQGELDSLCVKEGAQMLMNRAKSKDKNLIMFPGAKHHLLLEKDEVKTQVMNETWNWLESHYSTTNAPRVVMEPMKMSPRRHEELKRQLREENDERRREQLLAEVGN